MVLVYLLLVMIGSLLFMYFLFPWWTVSILLIEDVIDPRSGRQGMNLWWEMCRKNLTGFGARRVARRLSGQTFVAIGPIEDRPVLLWKDGK